MTQFVESLHRLYQNGKINEAKLKRLLQDNKITQQDYEYIVSVKER